MPDVVSSPGLLKDIAALGTGLAAVAGGVIAILQYFKRKRGLRTLGLLA
jgi:hypothetical protein